MTQEFQCLLMSVHQATVNESEARRALGQKLQFSNFGYDGGESYGKSIENNIPYVNLGRSVPWLRVYSAVPNVEPGWGGAADRIGYGPEYLSFCRRDIPVVRDALETGSE